MKWVAKRAVFGTSLCDEFAGPKVVAPDRSLWPQIGPFSGHADRFEATTSKAVGETAAGGGGLGNYARQP